ncbi:MULTISPECIES: hypothetical protein [unclassified Desulfovibrio]|uniref:Zinc finger CHC2-type domain-containing protein n=1 Tax=Desulfovibrio desulfuricans (strain ATCC 27774 / DSM 6949 / MB) TaxID=525146 RepID=B8J489_DESDA
MNETVDFKDVLLLENCSITEKSGNIKCPFCNKLSFKIYPDQLAKCHNNVCNWYGDVIQFYTDFKKISRSEAFKELAGRLDLKKSIVEIKEQTFDEARMALAEDLEFLSWCRMYFAFYKNDVVDQKVYAEKCGLSKSAFSRILNGNMGNALTWRKTIVILKQEIDIKRLQKDIKKGIKYFLENIPPEYIKKYRIKKKKK